MIKDIEKCLRCGGGLPAMGSGLMEAGGEGLQKFSVLSNVYSLVLI